MGHRIAASRLGIGTLTNSTITASRLWFTILRPLIAAATRVRTFTQGETLMATINAVWVQTVPSLGNGAVAAATRASLIWVPSLSTGNTFNTGTFVVKESTKTLNKITRLFVLAIGSPDPAR